MEETSTSSTSHPSSSGKKEWIVMALGTLPLPERKKGMVMVLDIVPLLEKRERWSWS